jgi:hypothetical protein
MPDQIYIFKILLIAILSVKYRGKVMCRFRTFPKSHAGSKDKGKGDGDGEGGCVGEEFRSYKE